MDKRELFISFVVSFIASFLAIWLAFSLFMPPRPEMGTDGLVPPASMQTPPAPQGAPGVPTGPTETPGAAGGPTAPGPSGTTNP